MNNFDKDAIKLFFLKFISYAFNTLIVLAVIAGVVWFIWGLFQMGTARIKRTHPTGQVIQSIRFV